MKALTYHHIVKREHGGRTTVENGALLSTENHQWFNKQTIPEQERMNRIFQEYKLGVLELNNGRVVQAEIVRPDIQEYDVIPLEVDNRKYNRARVKKETEQLIERYYKERE